MRNVTRRQLRAFAAVVTAQGFSGAAKALHVTQPAVSLQVKELEAACGLPLLDRSGRRIRPTEAGREILRVSQAFEREMRSAEERLSALKGLRGGRLTVAVISTAQYFGPRLLAAFRERHPEVELRLHVFNREAVIRHLEEDDVDLAIMGRPPQEIETLSEPFAPNPHVMVAYPGHPLAGRRRIDLRQLLDDTIIAREPGSGTRGLADGLFARHHLQFRPTLVISSNEAIKQAVIAGMGVAFLSLHTVGVEVAQGTLKVLDVPDLPVVRRWYVVHRRDRRLAPAAQAFRDFMVRDAGAVVAGLMAPAIKAGRLRHRLLEKD